MVDIIDAGYTHAKRICKGSEMNNLGEYHDLYVPGVTLSPADIFYQYVFHQFYICIFSKYVS